MRKPLSKMDGIRTRFSATFERYGSKRNWNGYPVATVLLRDVRDASGKVLADHVWLMETKAFKAAGPFATGDGVSFDARVRPYVKGYVNRREYIDEREIDFKMGYPTRVAKIPHDAAPDPGRDQLGLTAGKEGGDR